MGMWMMGDEGINMKKKKRGRRRHTDFIFDSS